MAKIYTIRARQTSSEWLVERDDGAEYVVSRIPCRGAKHPVAGAGYAWRPLVNPGPLPSDPDLDNTIPSLPPAG